MLKRLALTPFFETPGTGGGGGTTENVATTASERSISSGTASEAMIKAATAASSAESTQSGEAAKTAPLQTPAGAGETGTTAAATTQTGAKVQAPGSAEVTRGEAPEARIQTAVKNARAAVHQEYAWAQPLANVPKEHLPEVVGWMVSLLRDPAEFHARLGRELAAARGAETVEDKLPDPDLVSPDGKYKTHSDGNLAKIIDIVERRTVRRMEQAMGERMAPLLERDEKLADAERRQANAEQAGQILQEASKWKHFNENKSLIYAKLAEMDPQVRAKNPEAALYRCYQAVLDEVVYPSITQSAEKTVHENNQRKAAASVGVHPTQQQGGAGKAPELKNVTDLAAHMERLSRQQAPA